MSQTYPLVVYGPQGEPRDVVDAADEAAWTARGYRRHWHMGGTYGLPEVPVTVLTTPTLTSPTLVSPTVTGTSTPFGTVVITGVPDAPLPSARRSKKLTPPARPAKE
jgi:hypothetical protein